MTKRKFLAVMLAFALAFGFAAGSASALDIGGGVLLDYSGNNGIEMSNAYAGLRILTFGAYGFVDFGLVELSLGAGFGSITEINESYRGNTSADFGSITALDINVLGKFPINMRTFVLFPMIGLSYNMVLSAKDEYGNTLIRPEPSDFSQFGVLGGVGADFYLSRTMFIRAEGLLQMRFASTVQDDWARENPGTSTTLGFGPRIKVAVGAKL